MLVRAGSDRRNLAGLDAAPVVGSLDDHASLTPAMRGCEALFHVAADYRLWVPEPDKMYRTNVDGTVALMEAALAAGVSRIVHTSSVATLGLLPDGSDADEATPVTLAQMIGPYKRSKFLSEKAVQKLVRERQLPAVIVNPSTPVGPRDVKPTPTGRTIVEAASGKHAGFRRYGPQLRPCRRRRRGPSAGVCQGRDRRALYPGWRESDPQRELLAMIAGMVDRKPPTVSLPINLLMPLAYGAEYFAKLTGKEPFVTRDGLTLARKKMFFTIAKARRELGYAPRPAEDGIRDAIGWFRANGYIAA